MCFLPFKLIDSLFGYIWLGLKSKWKHLIGLVFTIILFHLFSSFYQSLFDFSLISISVLSKVSSITNYYVDNSWKLTFTLIVVYFITIALYWKEEYAFLFQLLSLPVWLSILFLSSKLMGSYRPLFTIAFLCLTFLGIYSFIYEYWTDYWPKNKRRIFQSHDDFTDDENNETLSSFTSSTFKDDASVDTLVENLTENESQVENLNSKKENEKQPFLKSFFNRILHFGFFFSSGLLKRLTSFKRDDEEETNVLLNPSKLHKKSKRQRENSDKYFILLFWLFICVKLRFDLYIAVPILVLIWKLFRKTVSLSHKIIFEKTNIKSHLAALNAWFECRKAALAPKPFLLLFKLFSKGDHKINQLLQNSLDSLISAFMIIGLLLFVSWIFLILAINIF